MALDECAPVGFSWVSNRHSMKGLDDATDRQRAKAAALRALQTDDVVVLPNAWDAASAALIAAGGAQAIATTSAGVSWSLGRPDGQNLTRAEMIDAVARIAAVVDLPVSADVEGGYGPGADSLFVPGRGDARNGRRRASVSPPWTGTFHRSRPISATRAVRKADGLLRRRPESRSTWRSRRCSSTSDGRATSRRSDGNFPGSRREQASRCAKSIRRMLGKVSCENLGFGRSRHRCEP
ncbi:isocitrate lyase/phosphoenolpyruvate mutase family protein [Pseudonocardia sp. RS11V-5]|uniref:isocitrate lyase/phosphoenolpyruvate mutase family protein n=1 Tax=Pseudonocardia terrae TaxID=2905831 RepID=UPI001E2A2D90|nr:isocitrate lyase/phosphoenolpyruvate mutase family protein [Pseudonocardia terrae]MCE3556041.1 isocitrate lyase/phosphoenolpyruvate mutase family protein [Pseudonocardia terrae]